MEDQHSLSLRLYEILETVGASETIRKLHRRATTTKEILLTLGGAYCISKTVICGSAYEGSITPGLYSDIDEITCLSLLPIVLDAHASTTPLSLLTVRNEWTYPGYVKLQIMHREEPQTLSRCNHLALLSLTCKLTDLDAVGRVCLLRLTGVNNFSPAKKLFGLHEEHAIDEVRALECSTLPEFAIQRLKLFRKRGLISDEEFEKLKRMGCLLVQAGYYRSSERNVEWRLSLSLQERYLMSKMKPTQHKVYILLKLIKKNIIGKVCSSDIFTSYHCKTCVLYAVEMTTTRAWTPENLINCFILCIKLLILWLRKKFCPNFFIQEQNLFSKKGFHSDRKRLLRVMELVLQQHYYALTLIQTDHVGDILKYGIERWRKETDVNANTILMMKLKVRFNMTIGRVFHGMNRWYGLHRRPLNLLTHLRSLQQTDTLPGYTAAETQRALKYLKPWFHLHIAKSLASLTYRSLNRSNNKRIMRVADFHFRKAERCDLVNVRLAKAAILYKSEHYETCFRLLEQVDNDFDDKVKHVCSCIPLHHIVPEGIPYRDMSVKNILTQFYAYCVIFLPSEFLTVPTPLQYEMLRSFGSWIDLNNFWYNLAVVDAKVYLYFMQYLVSTKLQRQARQQAAMDNILAEIEKDNRRILAHYNQRQLGHTETAYNLLGWVYMQEQRYSDAKQCFLKSLEIRPFHNAAKFHMRDLMAKQSDRQQQGAV